ncbi:hypothetical protein [Brevibacillus panacihumi]|uniref:hypothetical protein n=1 Tax=Brevibacillus panacihumi TaxID=497735 RepID=UPI003D245AB0
MSTLWKLCRRSMLAVLHHCLRKFGKSDPELLQFLLDRFPQKFYVKSHSMSFQYTCQDAAGELFVSVSTDDTDAKLKEPLTKAILIDRALFWAPAIVISIVS